MVVTINAANIQVQSDNLVDWTNYTSVVLYESTDCGTETETELEFDDVVSDTITLSRAKGRGVHSFRLYITTTTGYIQERYTIFRNGEAGSADEAVAKQALACDVLALTDENAYLWFYILNEAACNCEPSKFCSLWSRLKSKLDGTC